MRDDERERERDERERERERGDYFPRIVVSVHLDITNSLAKLLIKREK